MKLQEVSGTFKKGVWVQPSSLSTQVNVTGAISWFKIFRFSENNPWYRIRLVGLGESPPA